MNNEHPPVGGEERPLLQKDNDKSTAEDYGMSAFRINKEYGFTWRRVLVFVLQIVPGVPLVYWFLFCSTAFDMPDGNPIRNILVFVWIVAVLLSYEVKVLYIERQYTTEEVFFVVPILFPLILVYIAISARKNDSPIGILDSLAGLLVLLGIFLNTWPEIVRMMWKKRQENKGKLYTIGYFKHVRNINYLGDVIWASGWALASNIESL